MSFPLMLRVGPEGASTGEYFPLTVDVNSLHEAHISAGGGVVRYLATVPAGEIWLICAFSAKNNTAQRSEIEVFINNGSDLVVISGKSAPLQFETVEIKTYVFAKGGWQLGSWFRDTQANDVLQTDIIYVKIKS